MNVCKVGRAKNLLGAQADEKSGRPAWVEDSSVRSCHACSKSFSLTIRKHHCRNCGNIFCSKCCSKKTSTSIVKFNYHEAVRVCTPCHKLCTSGDELLCAVQSNAVSTVGMLLTDSKVSPDYVSSLFRPLQVAAAKGNLRILEMLLDADADVNWAVPSISGLMVLQCPECGHTKAFKINAQGRYVCPRCEEEVHHPEGQLSEHSGKTALHMAVHPHGHTAAVDLLLCRGANGNARTEMGFNALYYAAIGNHTAAARRIIAAGVDVSLPDEQGQTALHIACEHGFEQMVELLLKANADTTAKDVTGTTPAIVAERNKHTHILAMIASHRLASLNDTDAQTDGQHYYTDPARDAPLPDTRLTNPDSDRLSPSSEVSDSAYPQ